MRVHTQVTPLPPRWCLLLPLCRRDLHLRLIRRMQTNHLIFRWLETPRCSWDIRVQWRQLSKIATVCVWVGISYIYSTSIWNVMCRYRTFSRIIAITKNFIVNLHHHVFVLSLTSVCMYTAYPPWAQFNFVLFCDGPLTRYVKLRVSHTSGIAYRKRFPRHRG